MANSRRARFNSVAPGFAFDQFNEHKFSRQIKNAQLVRLVFRYQDQAYDNCASLHEVKIFGTVGEVNMYERAFYNWFSSNNMLNKDFELYSTYSDAIQGTNKWSFCNYDDAGVGFPRDCGPTGFVGGQWNSKRRGGQKHWAIYIDTSDGVATVKSSPVSEDEFAPAPGLKKVNRSASRALADLRISIWIANGLERIQFPTIVWVMLLLTYLHRDRALCRCGLVVPRIACGLTEDS
jgi:hypothetical protein